MNLSKEEIRIMVETMTPEQRKSAVQGWALKAWKDAGYRGTFEGATGVGKSRPAILAAAEELEINPFARIYICVPTETLRDKEWPDEIIKWHGQGLLASVKLICHKAMNKIRDEEIDLIIFDECHHITATNATFFTHNKVFKIFGLTATMTGQRNETDSDKTAMLSELCPSVFKVSLEEGIALELIANFKVKVLLFDLDNSDMYVTGGTKKRPFKTTEASQYKYLTRMLQKMTWTKNDAAKFTWIQRRVELLTNLKSKTELAKQCMERLIKPDNRTLVFCGSIRQSMELCGENVYNSTTDNTYLSKFQLKEINYLGCVDALNEGKNIEDLDQSLVVQLNSNSRTIIQRIGRNIRWRPGHEALITVLVAKKTADENWYREAFREFDQSRITEYYVTRKQEAA